MANKEFRHYGKGDLIELIYQMKQNEIELRKELQATREQLDEKTIKIEEAGSIAEAAIRINSIFEYAQKTADEYVAQVRLANEEIAERCKRREQETEEKCRQREQEAEESIAARWDAFIAKAEAYIAAHAELSNLLKKE